MGITGEFPENSAGDPARPPLCEYTSRGDIGYAGEGRRVISMARVVGPAMSHRSITLALGAAQSKKKRRLLPTKSTKLRLTMIEEAPYTL